MGTQRELPDAQNLLHYLELIAAAEAPADVLDAVQRYLDAWPKARIKALQKIDGGWAPFSQRQAPSRINGVRDLRRVRDAVYGQCAALRQAGVQLTPELMELDEILFVATRLAESMRTPQYKARAAGNTGRLRLAKLV